MRVKPDSAKLKIYVTVNSENPNVRLILYSGLYSINPEPPIERIIITNKDTIISLPVDRDYSVKARYKIGNDSISVVNGSTFGAKEIKQTCDEICWVISGEKINVKLEFSSVK
jgi:hypothetical protein